MSNIRMVTTSVNDYFINNKLMIKDNIPNEGIYNIGDIIIKENQIAGEAIGWICISAGNPGTWTEFGKMPIEHLELEDGSVDMSKLTLDIKAKLLATDNINIYFNQIKPVLDNINNVVDEIGDMELLDTNAKDTLVNAINEVKSNIGNNVAIEEIGDIKQLITNDKSNLVNAINEIKTVLNEIQNDAVNSLNSLIDEFIGGDTID